ncbi:Gfo/Idh/MocA family oxidoreductase [Streptomyces sp. NPDC059816]|uniref:Gfo/Idh/MocA family oxidoreductase n=1 Tax=Streptomyces sp. NPDC059816 TaxID=3346960 RepID=UPI0036677BF2
MGLTSKAAVSEQPDDRWSTVRVPLSWEETRAAVAAFARAHGFTTAPAGTRALLLRTAAGEAVVSVRWKPAVSAWRSTTRQSPQSDAGAEVLIEPRPGGRLPAEALHQYLTDHHALPYTPAELDAIRAGMPLLDHYSTPTQPFDGWAMIFRDHYLEHSVGFVTAMERAGTPARWILALDKGDRTLGRTRVHATFRARGYTSALLDNAHVNDPAAHTRELASAGEAVDRFIEAAHQAGRRVLVVDDGGLLARGYGTRTARHRVDAALELTVSGLKRITAAPPLAVPVLNLARSQVKTRLGYREIADSCLRRLRTILPDRKLIGRPIVLLGYGTLGSRLAAQLRSLGCRVTVVDTDLPTLIGAAEDGFSTCRTLTDALLATTPTMVIGTTGEQALTPDDVPLLPGGVLLAPFATADFSHLTQHPEYDRTVVPGTGVRFTLPGARTVTLLGDGRSLNLFEADSIPNGGYDAYRAATLIAAHALCTTKTPPPPGVHTAWTDTAITNAGLWEAYYRLHCTSHPTPFSVPATRSGPRAMPGPRPGRAAVVGYGTAGRLHTRVLAQLGATLAVVDPKHQDLPAAGRAFPTEVAALPPGLAAGIDLWTVCCPTADHLPVLRAILAHQPAARVLLEKPACQGHEIDDFVQLLAEHPDARVVVNDQYRHTTTLPALRHALDPTAPITSIEIVFTKNRQPDHARGRFTDPHYGVLGYEWLHMLAVLRETLPEPLWNTYLATDPITDSRLEPVYHPGLFVAALTEHTTLTPPGAPSLQLTLTSSILGPTPQLTGPEPDPAPGGPWTRGLRPGDDRHRHLTVHTTTGRAALHLDPVTTPGGRQLERNHHRLTAFAPDNRLLDDQVLYDSPMETSLHHGVTTLLDTGPLTPPDLAPLKRIARIADHLRTRTPHRPPDQPEGDRP